MENNPKFKMKTVFLILSMVLWLFSSVTQVDLSVLTQDGETT